MFLCDSCSVIFWNMPKTLMPFWPASKLLSFVSFQTILNLSCTSLNFRKAISQRDDFMMLFSAGIARYFSPSSVVGWFASSCLSIWNLESRVSVMYPIRSWGLIQTQIWCFCHLVMVLSAPCCPVPGVSLHLGSCLVSCISASVDLVLLVCPCGGLSFTLPFFHNWKDVLMSTPFLCQSDIHWRDMVSPDICSSSS